MAFTNTKLVIATTLSAGLFALFSYGLHQYAKAKGQFDREIAGEFQRVARSIEVVTEVQQYREAGDHEGASRVMSEFQEAERKHQKNSPLLKRLEANRRRQAGEVEVAPKPAPVKRLKGAYYPGDLSLEPGSSGASIMALGLAGGGGLLVFGLGGLVSLRMMGGSNEEESTEEALEEKLPADLETPELADTEEVHQTSAQAWPVPEFLPAPEVVPQNNAQRG